MFGNRSRLWAADSARSSRLRSPRDLPLRTLHLLHRFLPRLLHVLLCSTRFLARSAPFSGPLTLRSHALKFHVPSTYTVLYFYFFTAH